MRIFIYSEIRFGSYGFGLGHVVEGGCVSINDYSLGMTGFQLIFNTLTSEESKTLMGFCL